jgi:hypothetical protein
VVLIGHYFRNGLGRAEEGLRRGQGAIRRTCAFASQNRSAIAVPPATMELAQRLNSKVFRSVRLLPGREGRCRTLLL